MQVGKFCPILIRNEYNEAIVIKSKSTMPYFYECTTESCTPDVLCNSSTRRENVTNARCKKKPDYFNDPLNELFLMKMSSNYCREMRQSSINFWT